MEEVFEGVVCWFDPKKGYGFISRKTKDGKNLPDLFCYFSDIVGEGFRTLKKDEKVTFTVGLNNKGQPKATNVTVVK